MMVTRSSPGAAAPAGLAPGELEIVLAFVNTLDIEAGTDELDRPAGLADWLRARDLPGGDQAATEADLRAAVAMREALRIVLSAHVPHSGTTMDQAAGGLGEIAARLPTKLAITGDGQVSVIPAGSGAPAGLAGLLLIAARAATAGTWARLKVCRADDCQWAFYDRSPTKTGCWCSMAVCGSRAKSRSYRGRGYRSRAASG